jgi:hypothetical protein
MMLLEADHRMRDVRFLQRRDLLGGQLHIDGSDRIVELMQLGGANDRRGDDRLRQEPSKRNLRAGHDAGFGHLGDAIRYPPLSVLALPRRCHGVEATTISPLLTAAGGSRQSVIPSLPMM